MLLVRNLIAMTALAVACVAINPSGSNNLRPEHANERHLYEEWKEKQKMTHESNTMYFNEPSSSEDYSYKKRLSYNKYKVYKGSYTSEDTAFKRDGVKVKNKKKTLIVTRKPRPYKKPSSWNGDGYPSNRPTPFPIEPIESPEPTTSWHGDAYTKAPTPSPFEPIESPEPTTSWKDDGFEPVVTDPPSQKPTMRPTRRPSNTPTNRPSNTPTNKPSRRPSNKPTPFPIEPIESPEPTTSWHGDAYTKAPTPSPFEPIESPEPTTSWKDDGFEPVVTDPPTQNPTMRPTRRPSHTPTNRPTDTPTNKPSRRPSNKPTKQPTQKPTNKPSMKPTRKPTRNPSAKPTKAPTPSPIKPVVTPEPSWKGDSYTAAPTEWNGDAHSPEPEPLETPVPSFRPSLRPTKKKSYLEPIETSAPTIYYSPEPTVYYYDDKGEDKDDNNMSNDDDPEPTVYYDDDEGGKEDDNNVSNDDDNPMTDPISDPISDPQGSQPSIGNTFPGFPSDGTLPNIPESQLRKEVDEQCDEVEINDICVERCVVVTSIFQGETLIEESSTVSQSSCLSKRQEAKQNQE